MTMSAYGEFTTSLKKEVKSIAGKSYKKKKKKKKCCCKKKKKKSTQTIDYWGL